MAFPTNFSYSGFGFNSGHSSIMHIDLNSCFATVEQQANPLLRDKPIAVAAYDNPNGCILAPSVQAKKLGIKVGMRIKEAKTLFPDLIVLTPDPDKYRFIHNGLKTILSDYSPRVSPRSIDEFVLDFSGTPSLKRGLHTVGLEIKDRIKKELGDYLTVSIGFGPNRFLAKTASNLHKPDGLDEINKDNFLKIYQDLSLEDLTGIASRNSLRLNLVGIHNVLDFFYADIHTLKRAFKSVLSRHWFARLRGWEVDELDWETKSFGHSYSPKRPLTEISEIAPLLSKLVEKLGFRMRSSKYQAKGIHLGVSFRNYNYWHKGISLSQPIFSSQDIYNIAYRLLCRSPRLPVRNLSITCFGLSPRNTLQLSLFEDGLKKESLVNAIDEINNRWGSFVLAPAVMTGTQDTIKDYIAFGNVRS